MKKNVLYIALCSLVGIAVCLYLYASDAAFDGALLLNLVPYVFTIPFVSLVKLFPI